MTDFNTLRRTLDEMHKILSESNARAERAAYEWHAEQLKDAIKRFGVRNALGAIPDILRDMIEPHDYDYSQQDRDYQMAAEVMEAALLAVDLAYSEGSSLGHRRKQLEAAIESMKGVMA